MSSLNIEFEGSRTAFNPSDTIAGTARWDLGGSSTDRLELHLLWFTRGKGTEDASVIETVPVEHPPLRGEQRFKFTAPAAPQSFSGTLISLVWAIELVAPEDDDLMERVEVVIAPGAVEIELERIEPPKKYKSMITIG